MGLRFGNLYTDGYYHVFNRGTDKRTIFSTLKDMDRFCILMEYVNTSEVIGNVHRKGHSRTVNNSEDKLVEIYAYALLPNHYHIVLKQLVNDGVSKYIQKLSMGYTKFFNKKYDRSGVLFQGKYKYIEISSDMQLMRLVSYVNRNAQIHRLSASDGLVRTSHQLFCNATVNSICDSSQGLSLFGTVQAYKQVSEKVAMDTIRTRQLEKENYDLLE